MEDPRKPVFNAIRQAKPDGKLLEGDVAAIHGLLDGLGVPREAPETGQGEPIGRAKLLADPAAFFAAVRADFGPLAQSQVDGFTALLAAIGGAGWGTGWTAYALATAWHETARTMLPIKEMGGAAYFHRMYDIQGARPAKARELGNLAPGDGARYAGRGYVQLTGKSNYVKAGIALGVDLAENPDLALDPGIAARILIWGMAGGTFTGKKLADYLPASGPATMAQFREARRIINGTDKAAEIAVFADRFQRALEAGGWS